MLKLPNNNNNDCFIFNSHNNLISISSDHAISPVWLIFVLFLKRNKVTGKIFDFFTLRPSCFFSIQVSKITLENFELVNYKQRLIFEIWIHRPLPLWFQMTARQFWSKHSENKVTLNQLNELAYVNRAHSPSDQLMAFLQVVFTRYENYLEVYKINKPLSGLLVYRRIMPLAERLSLKFHSCPRSFASRPTVHFLDNHSALGIILQYTGCRKGFIY